MGTSVYAANGTPGQIEKAVAIGGLSGFVAGGAGNLAGLGVRAALFGAGITCQAGFGTAAGFAIGAAEGAAFGATQGFVAQGLITGSLSDAVMAGWKGGLMGAAIGGPLGAIFHQVCFTAGTLVHKASGEKAIETQNVGQRVLTVGTLATAQLPGDDPTEINPAIYRLVRLRTTKPLGGGSVVHAALLRQLSWLSENHVVEGGMIPFCVPELSIEGPACVLAIEPCPEIEPGRGRVITGTFRTTNCRVLQVRLPGEDRPLEPTPPHRFKSLDRNDWIPAEELRIGENLQTKAGQVGVESVEEKLGLYEVYNVQIEVEHHYFVGKTGVLVHNACERQLLFPFMEEEEAEVSAFNLPDYQTQGPWGWFQGSNSQAALCSRSMLCIFAI